MHIEYYKSVMHMALFLIVLVKIHFVDKKLSLLEKRFIGK